MRIVHPRDDHLRDIFGTVNRRDLHNYGDQRRRCDKKRFREFWCDRSGGVLTYHNNLSRDGTNTREYALTPPAVNTATFGKLFSCQADGAIYAQPLWVPNVTTSGATHNVIVVATQHDSVYAFDADASPCVTLWHANLLDSAHGGTSGETTVPSGIGGLVGAGYGDSRPKLASLGRRSLMSQRTKCT